MELTVYWCMYVTIVINSHNIMCTYVMCITHRLTPGPGLCSCMHTPCSAPNYSPTHEFYHALWPASMLRLVTSIMVMMALHASAHAAPCIHQWILLMHSGQSMHIRYMPVARDMHSACLATCGLYLTLYNQIVWQHEHHDVFVTIVCDYAAVYSPSDILISANCLTYLLQRFSIWMTDV